VGHGHPEREQAPKLMPDLLEHHINDIKSHAISGISSENNETLGTTVSYVCKGCNNIFFTLSEVTYHKAMTGHQEYTEKRKEPTNRE
jgi:hypothetical protein